MSGADEGTIVGMWYGITFLRHFCEITRGDR